MAMSAATLGTELQAMVPAASESIGIDNFSAAFETYFYESTVGGVSATPGTLAAATTAMKAAMIGVSATGPTAITAGITAFWGVVATSAATIWVLAPVLVSATPPTGLAGITPAVAAAGAANISGQLSLADSANSIATAIHTPNLGGLGVIVTPPGGTLPIL